MAKSKKSAPVEAEYKPIMYMEGKQAKAMMHQPVGKKVKVVVDAVITSQSQSRGFDGQMRHSMGLEINRMKPATPKKAAPKRKK